MKQISLEELQKMQAAGIGLQLIDVREPEEHYACNIGGDLIPLGEIMRNSDRIARDCPVVFYCRKGIRSQIAIQRLSEQLPDTFFYNLTGGLSAYGIL